MPNHLAIHELIADIARYPALGWHQSQLQKTVRQTAISFANQSVKLLIELPDNDLPTITQENHEIQKTK